MSDQEPTTEQTDHPIAGSGRRPPWVSGGVASVGAASFFSDTGHEIATAVLPSFLTSVLRGSAGVLGVIEGLSDGLLGIAKLVAGPPANDPARRVRIARGGYLLTGVFTAAIGLSSAVWQAGILRAAAWVSRGARGPARDALLASLAPKDAYGRSFGVERAGDNLGAVLGPLLAALLVAVVGIRHAFFFALVPGLFAALAISVAAAKAPRVVAVARERARLELGNLRRAGLFGPLLPVAAFELGNVTTTLLILRVTQLLHHGDRSLTTAASPARVSGWPRRPSRPWSPTYCRIDCGAAGSGCSAGCSRRGTSCRRRSSGCCTRRCLPRPASPMPRAGWCCRSRPRRSCGRLHARQPPDPGHATGPARQPGSRCDRLVADRRSCGVAAPDSPAERQTRPRSGRSSSGPAARTTDDQRPARRPRSPTRPAHGGQSRRAARLRVRGPGRRSAPPPARRACRSSRRRHGR